MASEKTGGAEMSALGCLLPREDGYLGLGKSGFTTLAQLFSTVAGGLLTDTLPSCNSVDANNNTSPRISDTRSAYACAVTRCIPVNLPAGDLSPPTAVISTLCPPRASSQRPIHPNRGNPIGFKTERRRTVTRSIR